MCYTPMECVLNLILPSCVCAKMNKKDGLNCVEKCEKYSTMTAMIVADQLQTLADHQLVDDCRRMVEIFDSLGNVRPELLAENAEVGIVIESGELSPESSDNGSDCGETFAFGNNKSD